MAGANPSKLLGKRVNADAYLYDAEGRRVAKGTITPNASQPCNPATNGFNLTESYVLGQSGEQLTVLDRNNNWRRTNVYGAGQLLATYDTVGLHFHLTDPLGTRRIQTNAQGQPELDCQSLAFGDQQYCFPDANAPASAEDATALHFAGKERDAESGLDNFGARYYGSSMGRFMSPDPSGLYFADPTNPQSLNLYSYAQNNPLKNIDPDGLRCVWDDGSFDAEDDKQTGNQGSCESQGGTWHDPNTYAKGADWASTNSDGTLQLHGAAPSESVTVTGTATGYVGDAAVWFGGYINDVGLGYTNATNLITGGRQVPYDRFFGTHYCGPGGSGQPNGTLDKACKVHDECFAAAGLDASVNVGTSTAALSPTQAAAAQKCNQGLYNAARANPGKTGSSSLRLWLTQSVSTPFGGYVLYPGTQAKTW